MMLSQIIFALLLKIVFPTATAHSERHQTNLQRLWSTCPVCPYPQFICYKLCRFRSSLVLSPPLPPLPRRAPPLPALPPLTSPNVLKNCSISLCSVALRRSASSRARSTLRIFTSARLCQRLCCSSREHRVAIWSSRASLQRSNLPQKKKKKTDGWDGLGPGQTIINSLIASLKHHYHFIVLILEDFANK